MIKLSFIFLFFSLLSVPSFADSIVTMKVKMIDYNVNSNCIVESAKGLRYSVPFQYIKVVKDVSTRQDFFTFSVVKSQLVLMKKRTGKTEQNVELPSDIFYDLYI